MRPLRPATLSELRQWLPATLLCLLLGCVRHSDTVRTRFQHEFECHREVSIHAIGGSSYVAEGCGARATYTCTTDHPTSTYGGTSACVRESTKDEWALPEVGPAAVSGTPANSRASARASSGSVERSFDAERALHVVRATFKPAGLDADIMLVGAPEQELSIVYLHVLVRGNQRPWHGCSTLRILVNAEPLAGERVEIEHNVQRRMMMRASGRFEFEMFKPLARKHAEFGVELCNQPLVFSEQQMPNLIKFLEIFSQLASDAQAKAQAAATPEQTTPQAPIAADAGVQL